MAQKQITITLESKVLNIQIDVANKRLTLSGALVVSGTATQVLTHTEDVTALLTPEDIAAITLIVNRAQQWIDAKMP